MTDENLLRVTRIRVEDLFNCYSHDVPLRLDDRVTIIHGPNGVGKTVLLRLTDALLSGRLTGFANIPFARFEVELSDGSRYGVKRTRHVEKNETGVIAYFESPSHEESQFMLRDDPAEILRLANRIENESPWLARYTADQFMDRRTEEIVSAWDVVARYAEFLPETLRQLRVFEEPKWMQEVRNRVGVHLIEAQRLFRFATVKDRDYGRYHPGTQGQYTETVKNYAKDLQRRISETLNAYAKESQALDQSFPQRLLSQPGWSGLPIDDLKKRMEELEQKRQQLKRIGLIEQDAAYPFDVSALEKTDESQRSVMTLYVDDTAKKLGVLDDLSRRIQLMLENINRKFTNKSIRINREKGLTAVTRDTKELELAALSSGEQHELVLLYDLLLRVKSNTLVLLDEPELSLHVTWQKSFLPDLLEIVAATKFDVVLATHSPFIVGDRTDLMTPLNVD